MDDRTLVGDDAMVASSVLAACDSFDRVDFPPRIVIEGFWFLVAEKSAKNRAERERVTCVDFRIVIYAVPAKSMLEVEHLRQAVQFI